MKCILFLIILSFAFVAQADDYCQKLDEQASAHGVKMDNTDNIYKVSGRGRLYFYFAPDRRCPMKGTFIISGQSVSTYLEYQDYYSVMFMTEGSEQITGWVNKKRLLATHTGVGPDYGDDNN